MEASTLPDIIEAADTDMDEFLESLGLTEPVGDSLTDIESRIDWLMQLIAERRTTMQQNNDVADRRTLMIADWRDGENAIQASQIEWLEYKIREHAPKSPEAIEGTYGKKSRKLPHGSFGFRRTPDSVEITDIDGAVAFAEANKLDVLIKYAVSKATLKAHAKATGECEGEGWRVVVGADVWFVKV